MLKDVGENFPDVSMRINDYFFKCCMIYIIQMFIIYGAK